MPARTAVRRTAVLGLGALGAMVLAAPAQALDAGLVTETVEPVAAVVDPLTAPLQPAAEEVGTVVEAAAEPTEATAPQPAGDPAPTTTAPSQTTQPAGTTAPTGPAVTLPREAAPGAQPGAVAGAGVASMPSSFSGSTTGLEGFTGRGAGFGTAANPMSLFGAPQVATMPGLSSEVPTPLAVTPAGGALADVLPVGAPEGVPAALAAVACAVVAGSVAAHVAALRARRESAVLA